MPYSTVAATQDQPGYIQLGDNTKVYPFYKKNKQHAWMANTWKPADEGLKLFSFRNPADPNQSVDWSTSEHYFQAHKCEYYHFTGTVDDKSAKKKAFVEAIKSIDSPGILPNVVDSIAAAVEVGAATVTVSLDVNQTPQITALLKDGNRLDISEDQIKAQKTALESSQWSNPKNDNASKGVDVMAQIIAAKCEQYSHLQTELLKTGDGIIIEASPYDSYWGISGRSSADDPRGSGKNMLGILWAAQRDAIREQQSRSLIPFPLSSVPKVQSTGTHFSDAKKKYVGLREKGDYTQSYSSGDLRDPYPQIEVPQKAAIVTADAQLLATIFNNFKSLPDKNKQGDCTIFKTIGKKNGNDSVLEVTTHSGKAATITKKPDALEVSGSKEAVLESLKQLYLLELATQGKITLDKGGNVASVTPGTQLSINPDNIHITGTDKTQMLRELDKRLTESFKSCPNAYQKMSLLEETVKASVRPSFTNAANRQHSAAMTFGDSTVDSVSRPGP